MQYVFLIRSRAGGKKYITRRFIANLRAIFYDILRKIFTQKHGTLFIANVVWT